jgi:nickel-dependent lactate racemase
MPGVAGFETIASHHQVGRLKGGLNNIEHNEWRADIEQIVRDHVGLDWILNVVPNSRREIAGLFVGDMVAAHRAGVDLARRVFATEMPAEPVDIAVCNAYPKDTELLPIWHGMQALNTSPRPVVKEHGAIVLNSCTLPLA